ncbi:Polar-differentiation response regulator DivK [subsurface metagenome]
MAGEIILVVEDNEKNRVLFRDILQSKGYKTIEAETGEKALVLLQKERPDLILMDIQLPGKDGITITREIKANAATKDIPVFALTSYAMKGDRERMMEAGFDGYMSKPIKVREFLKTVDDFFQSSLNGGEYGR